MIGDGFDLAVIILTEGERIEREKNGKALTPEEAKTVQAANFVMKIFASATGKTKPPTKETN